MPIYFVVSARLRIAHSFLDRFPTYCQVLGGLIGLAIAVALFSGSSEVWRSPSFPLFVASGCLFGLISARLLGTRRTSFSAPRFDALDPRTFASQASSGFLFGYEKSRGTMIHGGRQLGMAEIRPGHPLLAGIGWALSALGALFAPSFEKLQREVMSNSLQACDKFTAATASEGAAFIERGYQRVQQDLLRTIDSTVAKYDGIIEKLVNSQRSVTEALERRRTELRAAVEDSNRIQQQLETATVSIRSSLLGYEVASPITSAEQSASSGKSLEVVSSGASVSKIEETADLASSRSGSVLWWLACIASVIMFVCALVLSGQSISSKLGVRRVTSEPQSLPQRSSFSPSSVPAQNLAQPIETSGE